ACDGGCGKCNVDKKEGVCSPVAKDTECRAVAGNCDVAEVCDGTKVDCPADGFKAKDTECRAAAGDCDLAEVCDGNSASCPKDDLVADGQPSTGDECSPYLCDGQKVTCPTSCQDSPDCAGGTFCADGVCCDKPCSGPCQACNLQGSEGTCKAHAPGTDPEQGCGSGVCDGAGTCAAGGHLWSKRFGDESYQYGWAVAVDGAGNVFLASGFDGTVDFGGGPLVSAGNWDVFVAKLDQDGKHLWSKHFGDAESQWAYGVAVDTAGSVLVTGEFYGTVDFGGGPLASAGNDDIFVAKLEP
ncbi:MAG: hypothetical protein HY744_16080, partial [Deltaproteobacteria bacterium]|nr:hypothetical protein [Deltaproteobacteria bacterium]